MSAENIRKFLKESGADPALQGQVRAAAGGANPGEALASLAAGQGLSVSAAEFREYATAHALDELSINDLEGVVGGAAYFSYYERNDPK